MKDVLLFVLLIITSIILIKLFLKITSLILKIFLWVCIFFAAVYILNYYFLPKLGYQPLPIKEWISKITKEKIKLSVENSVEKQLKKIQKETKEFVSTKKVYIKDTLQKVITSYYNK